jgi:hypothetical protein
MSAVASIFLDADRMPAPVLLILPDEIMTVAEAALHAGRTEKTIRRWISEFGIARQTVRNSPHQVSRLGLDMVLHSDWPALDALKTGDRSHRLVVFYRQFAGLD